MKGAQSLVIVAEGMSLTGLDRKPMQEDIYLAITTADFEAQAQNLMQLSRKRTKRNRGKSI